MAQLFNFFGYFTPPIILRGSICNLLGKELTVQIKSTLLAESSTANPNQPVEN
jgi:hypothetical protein